MFNILRKKKNKVIFWSHIKGLEELAPIEPATKFFPDWFKNLKAFPKDAPSYFAGTVKTCPSFVDIYKRAFVIPLWCDLKITINNSNDWTWSSPSEIFQFSSHSATQYTNWLPEHEKERVKLILKPNCPWRCKTEKGYILMQQPLYYHFNEDFEVLPGFVETDIYHEINQQMIFRRPGEFFLKRGTPLCMYYVVKREEFELLNVNYEHPIIKNYNKGYTKKGYSGSNIKDFLRTKFNSSYSEIRKKYFNEQ